MPKTSAPTFITFLKAHSKTTTALTGAAFITPAVSLIPVNWASYLFPPIGDVATTAKLGLIAFSIAAMFCAYLLIGFARMRLIILSAVAASLICFVAYLVLSTLFIRTVEDPVGKTSIRVTVGYEHTEFAKKNFPDANDWEMLRQRGLVEEEIERLWTLKSIVIARILLVATYYATFLAWIFAFSCVVSWDLTRPAS
jgi:hypothetical protein